MAKKYTTYRALDFAQDDAFIKWVRHGKGQSFWKDWLKKHPEKAPEIQEAQLLVRAIQVKEQVPTTTKIDQLWHQIDAATLDVEVSPRVGRRVFMQRWVTYAAAASVIGFLFFFFWNREVSTMIESGNELMAYYLPDGSVVEMNAGATIEFQAENWSQNRTVNLTGEAFFQVEKGSPFLVKTTNGQVKVLGTSFNVDAKKGAFEVACFTGKVQVQNQSGEHSEILTPLEGVRLNATSGLDRFEFVQSTKATWREAVVFHFDKKPLQTVFKELERQFDLEIEYAPNISNKIYTGFFEKINVDSALYQVCWPMQLTYSKTGSKVSILE